VKVAFEGSEDGSGGLKWYTVIIIVLVVLIVVGVGYGMYLKMMKNKKDKQVSLLTEGEADEEV
jgi:Tfp pilus assembly protein PilO